MSTVCGCGQYGKGQTEREGLALYFRYLKWRMTASPISAIRLLRGLFFFLASVELASQSGIVAVIRLPQRRLVYFRDGHWSSLPSNGPSSLATRSVVSLPHRVH
jgi:hypothetical protein